MHHKFSNLLTTHFLVCFLFALNVVDASAQILTSTQVLDWEVDLDVFTTEFWRTFPLADERVDRQSFQQKIDQLKTDLPTLEEAEVIIRLQDVLALSTEGSNRIWPYQQALNYPMLPIKTFRFADGWFICDASPEYTALIGQEINSVNGLSAAALWEKLVPMMSGDNVHQQEHATNYHWQIAPWLAYLSEQEASNSALLGFADGTSVEVNFRPTEEYHTLSRQLPSYRGLNSSDKRYTEENYWMEYLPDGKTLFLQFIAIRDNEDGPKFKQFIAELETELSSGSVTRLIVDNRYGGGGNGFKLKPLTDLLREHALFQETGNLIVLTGRGTRGTVQEMSSILELNTKATFIGEPTSEGPNSVGDLKAIPLPKSGVDIWIVHKYWPTSWSFDEREMIEPQVYVFPYYQDFAEGRDAWLEAALTYEPTLQPETKSYTGREIEGKYVAQDYSIKIDKRADRYFLSMNRKMKSFFEWHTELYPVEEYLFATDITNVYLKVDEATPESVQLLWKGSVVDLVRR